MKPETAAYLAKAGQSLKEADVLITNELAEAAGRASYLAAFHAAQALIFEWTGKVAKTHSGVRAEFSRLSRNAPLIERSLLTFLGRAYSLKETADYAIGQTAGISIAQAAEPIESAHVFLTRMESLPRSR